MAPVDTDKLRHHLDYARRNRRQLGTIRSAGRDAFLEDEMAQHAAVRLLHTAIEALLDCGHHVIAREGLGIPKAYADTVSLLVDFGILPAADRETYLRMVRFRNRAVHLYDEIDAAEVWKILDGHLADFDRFIGAFVDRYFAGPSTENSTEEPG